MHASDSRDIEVRVPAPRTTTVLVFLGAFAVMISYLGAYAAANALVAANILKPWPNDADPRPQWMLNTFCVSFAVCVIAALLFRWISNRQLRRIDEMADAEDMRF